MGIVFSWPEGATPIAPDDLEGLIPSLSTQTELNEFEAQNVVNGMLWAGSSTTIRNSLLEAKTLRTLHQRLFGETWKWAGSYRTTLKNIGCEAWQIPGLLKCLQDDVKIWIEHQGYSPGEIAARFHHRLVWIHPFPNGNGRFARLATDLLCGQQGWPLSSWGSADLGKAGEARAAYISALRTADNHDFTPLISFIRG